MGRDDLPENNVAPLVDELPDPDDRLPEDPPGQTDDTAREADLAERDAGAHEEKVHTEAELQDGEDRDSESPSG